MQDKPEDHPIDDVAELIRRITELEESIGVEQRLLVYLSAAISRLEHEVAEYTANAAAGRPSVIAEAGTAAAPTATMICNRASKSVRIAVFRASGR